MPTLDDLVAGVFAAAEQPEFTSNTAQLHEFFSEIANEPDLPSDVKNLLEDVSFRAGQWCAFSRELERALMRLQVGGLLSARNPDFTVFEMNDSQRARANKRIEQLPKEDQEFVQREARRFRETVPACG